jgi:hypothetical protein
VSDVVAGSLRELTVKRHLAVRRAADALDAYSYVVLGEAQSAAGFLPPERRTPGQALNVGPTLDAIARLLDLTAIRAELLKITGEALANQDFMESGQMVRYRTTPFGTALLEYVVEAMGLDDPIVREHMLRLPRTDPGPDVRQ